MHRKITISGRICSGKSTLFSDLQRSLSWPTFSASTFFREYAKAKHVSIDKADEQSDQLTQIIDYGMGELLRKKDHVIFEGWMTGIVAGGTSDVMSILLVCDDKVRIKRFAIRENISEMEALKRIKERETSLFKILEKIYHRNDFVDPKNYKLILDTTKSTPEKTLAQVLKALK